MCSWTPTTLGSVPSGSVKVALGLTDTTLAASSHLEVHIVELVSRRADVLLRLHKGPCFRVKLGDHWMTMALPWLFSLLLVVRLLDARASGRDLRWQSQGVFLFPVGVF